MPNALCEAMACGVPCIASDIPGCRDLIRHNENGILVPPGNPPALAAALRSLLDSPAETSRMAATAARDIREKHTQNIHEKNYGDLLAHVINCAAARDGGA